MIVFDYNTPTHTAEQPHVTIEMKTDLNTEDHEGFRIPDRELKEKPTIEVLYQTGYKMDGEQSYHHFQFLRRVICAGIPKPPDPSSTTLNNALYIQREAYLMNRQFVENVPQAVIPEGTRYNGPAENTLDASVSEATRQEDLSKRKDPPHQSIIPVRTRAENTLDASVSEATRQEDLSKRKDPPHQSIIPVRTRAENTLGASSISEATRQEDLSKRKDPPHQSIIPVQTRYNDPAENTLDASSISETTRQKDLSKRKETPTTQSKGKDTKKVLAATKPHQKVPLNRKGKSYHHSTKRAKCIQKAEDTKKFNQMLTNGEITATRMFYDSSEKRYYVTNWANMEGAEGEIIRKTLVDDTSLYHSLLVERATQWPNTWVGPTIGDGEYGDAPNDLCTKIRTIYQQHNNPFCLIYSFASALFYCGFREEAKHLAETAQPFADMHFDQQILKLQELMRNLVPLIGGATIFGKRTKRHDRKKRWMTWEALFADLTPYPTIVIPIQADGTVRHAFCVVDDLIFDSLTPFALKLKRESVLWTFNDRPTKIFQVLRFNKKVSPHGTKVKGNYNRKISSNWAHPSHAKETLMLTNRVEVDDDMDIDRGGWIC